MNRRRKFAAVFLSVLSWLACLAVTMLISDAIRDTSQPIVVLPCICGFAVLMYLLIKNRYYASLHTKENAALSKEKTDRWKQGQEKASENPEEIYRQIQHHIRDIKISWILLFLSVTLLMSSLIILLADTESIFSLLFTLFSVFYLFLSYHTVVSFLYKTEPDCEEILLDPKTYPQLFKTLQDIRISGNISSKLRFYIIADDNIGVARIGRRHEMRIGLETLLLLSKEELEAVLQHEMAHIVLGDTAISGKFGWHSRLYSSLEESDSILTLLFYFLFYDLIAYPVFRCEYLLSQQTFFSEKRADLYVKEHANGQDYVNAVVKTWIYTLATESSPIGHRLCALPTLPEQFCTTCYQDFLDSYNSRKEFLDSFALSELPLKINSHPTVSQRMAYMEISDYTIDYTNQNSKTKHPEYYREVEQLLASFDTIYRQNATQELWDEMRSENVLPFLEKIKIYEQMPEQERQTLAIDQLNDTALAYRSVGDYKNAHRLCDQALLADAENPWANFTKGCMFLENLKEEGLFYVKKALGNQHLTSDALDTIYDFCIKTGNQKELEEFYTYSYTLIDDAEKTANDSFSLTDNTAYFLPLDAKQQENLSHLKTYTEISKIYSVCRRLENQQIQRCYAVLPIKEVEEERWSEITEEIWWYLENQPEEYFLLNLKESAKEEKYFKKISEALVYQKTEDKDS